MKELFDVCIYGNLEKLKELIKAGVNLEATDNNDDEWTALLYTSNNGHLEVVKELIKASVNLEVKDNCGWTALMIASYNNRLEVVKELIKAGANLEAKSNYGQAALMYASIYGHLEVIKELELKHIELNEIREIELIKYLYKKITKNVINYIKL